MKNAIATIAFALPALVLVLVLALALVLTIGVGVDVRAEERDSSPVNVDDLYRVELLVFAHRYNFSTDTEGETWRTETLGYPGKLEFVYPPPPEIPVDASPFVDTGIEDLPGTNPASPDVMEGEIAFTAIDDNPGAGSVDDIPGGDTTDDPVEPLLPTLMQYLPDDEYELQSIARTIKRRPEYRLLFHQSWYQELLPRKQAPHIPLAAGDQYGRHHEMEGSVKLSKGRYLHITTDLWLSAFVLADSFGSDNFYPGLDSAMGEDAHLLLLPQLPDFPRAPLREVDIAAACQPQGVNSFALQAVGLMEVSPEGECHTIGANEGEASTVAVEQGEAAGVQWLIDTESSPEPALVHDDVGVEAEIDPYRVEQTVVLREYRRMRSEEVHYLDHPKFGVVVRIVPYEVEGDLTGSQ